MADTKRKLNIPIYDASVAPEGAAFGDDVIDVEVIENAPTLGERVKTGASRGAAATASGIRNARVNGVKDAFLTQPADAAREASGAFDPRLRERQEGRARREQQSRVSAAQAADAKQSRVERRKLNREAETDPVARLKLNTVRAGESYVESLRAAGLLDDGQTPASQRKKLTGMHQVYASMMVLQCLQPLKDGVSAKTVASVLGMAASMWMLSPNFRTQVGDFAHQMRDAVGEKIDGRIARDDAKAQEKYNKLADAGKADQLAGRWQSRLDRMEHAARGHRLPFTTQSAAMTEVALAEAAYADMRRPGADPGRVQDRYQSALTSLYEYVDADGLDREDVSRSMRVIVGQRLEKDPSIANVFTELGHGRFTKSAPREVYINGTSERATVWTGDYVDSYEGRIIVKGSFRLRPPVGVNEHRVLAAETLSAEMVSAKSVGELNDVLSQYVVAASVGQFPDVIGQIDDSDARRRLGKAQTMFDSMSADGLSPAEQQFAYSAAYIDAVETAQRLNPELGNKWLAQHGDQWREKVAESMRLYSDLGAQAKRGTPDTEKTSGRENKPRFTATADGFHDAQNPKSGSFRTEDIVDAEEVVDVESNGHSADAGYPVYDGVLMDDEVNADDVFIDGEIVEDLPELEAGQARDSIVEGARSTSKESDYDQAADSKPSTRINRARVNQHYNEVETGGITGIGHDDAAPLQDVDFELG